MKKISIFLLFIIIMISGFSGCSKGFKLNYQFGVIENSTKHSMTASYQKLNGIKEKKITVEEGKPLEISVEIKTTSGSINVYIYNEDNENIYESEDIETSSFTIPLTEPGKYTLKVDANKHKGSYSFKW